jgi:flagellar FliL protein
MSKAVEAPSETGGGKNRQSLIVIILIAIIAIGIGAGGTWYAMKMFSDEQAESDVPKEKPITFVDLDIFTVNLQPEELSQYLQVGLTAKTRETPVVAEIKKQMPEIRNRILMPLSSKKAAELQEDVLEALFTSFVIQ